MAETAAPGMWVTSSDEWTRHIDADHDNILGALDACARSPSRTVLGLRLACALQRFWTVRGLFELGRRELARALKVRVSDEDRLLRAKALSASGVLAAFQNDLAEARSLFSESLQISEAVHDGAGMAAALNGHAHVAVNEGDLGTARAFLERSLAIRRTLGEPRGTAMALNNLGALLWRQGDLEAAGRTVAQGLEAAREIGDRYVLSLALANQELLALLPGGPTSSHERITECLSIIRELGAKRDAAAALEICASATARRGQFGAAARLYGAADALRQALGTPADRAWRAVHEPHVESARRRLGIARFDSQWSKGRESSFEGAMADALATSTSGSPRRSRTRTS
jgi:tetratricopeptide (TPR) repeat protein